MSRRMYKDFSKPATEQEQTEKHSRKKKSGGMKLFIRFMALCAALLVVYALALNWKSIAPDSLVAWVDDVIDGTTGGSWPVSLTGDTVFDMQEVGANLVTVTDTAVKYYNATGGESVKRTCAYASPMLRVADKYVLLLELGGNRYRLESRSQIELEQTVNNGIYTGAVSTKGDVAVVTDSSQSHISEVTVYSRSGTQRYQWLSSEWLVMDVAFSRDANTLAVVGCRAQDGAMQSAVLVFDLRGREEQPTQYIANGTLFSRVQYMRSGTVVAVGDNSAKFVNPTGSLDETVSYKEVELIGYAFGDNDVMFVTRPYGSQDGGTAAVHAASGDVRTEQLFEGAFRDATATGNGFLVLSDEYVYDINNRGVRDHASVSADSLMVSTVSGKALVLGLTQLLPVQWDDDTADTTATEETTVASTTASAKPTVATTTTTAPTDEGGEDTSSDTSEDTTSDESGEDTSSDTSEDTTSDESGEDTSSDTSEDTTSDESGEDTSSDTSEDTAEE